MLAFSMSRIPATMPNWKGLKIACRTLSTRLMAWMWRPVRLAGWAKAPVIAPLRKIASLVTPRPTGLSFLPICIIPIMWHAGKATSSIGKSSFSFEYFFRYSCIIMFYACNCFFYLLIWRSQQVLDRNFNMSRNAKNLWRIFFYVHWKNNLLKNEIFI